MSAAAASAQHNSASNATSPAAAPPARSLKMTSHTKAIDARKNQSPADAHRRPPAQKAWSQGSNNPLTQRPSNPTAPNGAANPPKPAHPSAALAGDSAAPMRHLSDRMMYLLANLTGLPGIITLKNGEKYSGVLSGTSLDPSELRYVFKMVKKLQPATSHANGDVSDDYIGVGDYHVMSFDMSDVADFNVNNVVLDKTQAKTHNGAAFRTDADISGNLAVRERNLQKWEPIEADPTMTLESTGRSTEWDQFSTNERLFGVQSSYDENIYTTTIDRSDPQYSQKAARAERIAREIEASSASNAHVREERGGHGAAADDQGLDEEDKYSGVRREVSPLPSGQSNKYTPPARRAPAAQSTVQGAPVDPAIISSSIARPDSAAAKAARTASPAAAEKTVTPPPPAKADSQKTDGPAPAQADVTKAAAAPKAETVPADQPAEQKPSTTLKTTVQAIPPRKTGRPHDATTNVEHDLLDSFKQFSAAEKLRMSERQRVIARENKAVKLNDLKKFAQNFKLSTPVPSDLVPILAKDETKQQAIVERALRQVQETKTTPPKATSALVDPKARPAAKADATSPTANAPTHNNNNQRRAGQQPFPSPNLSRSQQNNQIPSRNQGPLSTRLQHSQVQHKQQGAPPYNGVPQPIPTGPSQTSSGAQTPTSAAATRFNVRAHEFRPNPAASTFQPTNNTSNMSSPKVAPTPGQEARKTPVLTSFFGGQRPTLRAIEVKDPFSTIERMEKEHKDSDYAHNGGIPQPFRTPPTWDFPTTNAEKGYIKLFEHAAPPVPLAAPHNAMANGPVPHQHQLPPHLQGPQGMPQGPAPHHTPRGGPVQPHHGQPHFDGHPMQFSHSTSSVQPSPRAMPPYTYGSQPQPMPGYPQQVQMPHYGMSPNVQHVGLRGPQGGQFVQPMGPAMGGHMMTNQHSNGPFMGMPGNPQMQMYSPGPGHAYPQYPGHMPGPGANGFPSPRPGAPMMSHQGSQQGPQQPPMMYMQPGAPGQQMFQMPPGNMNSMRGPYPQPHHQPYGSSPHQHHQFPHPAHRGTPSGSYSQPMMHQHSQQHGGPPSGPANHATSTDVTEEPK